MLLPNKELTEIYEEYINYLPRFFGYRQTQIFRMLILGFTISIIGIIFFVIFKSSVIQQLIIILITIGVLLFLPLIYNLIYEKWRNPEKDIETYGVPPWMNRYFKGNYKVYIDYTDARLRFSEIYHPLLTQHFEVVIGIIFTEKDYFPLLPAKERMSQFDKIIVRIFFTGGMLLLLLHCNDTLNLLQKYFIFDPKNLETERVFYEFKHRILKTGLFIVNTAVYLSIPYLLWDMTSNREFFRCSPIAILVAQRNDSIFHFKLWLIYFSSIIPFTFLTGIPFFIIFFNDFYPIQSTIGNRHEEYSYYIDFQNIPNEALTFLYPFDFKSNMDMFDQWLMYSVCMLTIGIILTFLLRMIVDTFILIGAIFRGQVKELK